MEPPALGNFLLDLLGFCVFSTDFMVNKDVQYWDFLRPHENSPPGLKVDPIRRYVTIRQDVFTNMEKDTGGIFVAKIVLGKKDDTWNYTNSKPNLYPKVTPPTTAFNFTWNATNPMDPYFEMKLLSPLKGKRYAIDLFGEGGNTFCASSMDVYVHAIVGVPGGIPNTANANTTSTTTDPLHREDSNSNPTTTQIPRLPLKSSPDPSCTVRCTGSELNGRIWTACAGEMATDRCSLQQNTTGIEGYATWQCSESGQFLTSQPDYSTCRSTWVETLIHFEENEEEGIKISSVNITTSKERCLTYLHAANEKLHSKKEANFYGHEIPPLTNFVAHVLNDANKITETVDEFLPLAKEAINVTDKMFSSLGPWRNLPLKERCNFSTSLISNIETTSFLLSNKASRDSTTTFKQVVMDSENLHVESCSFSKSSLERNKAFSFPMDKESWQGTSITLPQGWASNFGDDRIELCGIIMDSDTTSTTMPGLGEQITTANVKDNGDQEGTILNSKLVSLTVGSSSPSFSSMNPSHFKIHRNFMFQRSQKARINFKHEYKAQDGMSRCRNGKTVLAARDSARCMYWDIQNLSWSQDGCSLVSISNWESVCECDHLTAFALLMDLHCHTGNNLGLEILTLILSSISILCLALAIFLYISSKLGRNNPKIIISTHLCICLLIGNVFVVVMLDRSYLNVSDGLCYTTGLLLHYIFLAAFGWMAILGVHLYHSVINVFNSVTNPIPSLIYKVSAYGVPLLIVGMTAIIGLLKKRDDEDGPYGNDVACWLNGHYLLGGFMGPVLIIILANTVILALAVRKSYLVQKNPGSIGVVSTRKVTKLRTLIKGCFALSMLMGLTWIVGYFMLIPSRIWGLIFAYLFTILNASQGIFILAFDVCMNEKMKQIVYQKWGKYLPTFLNDWLKKKKSESAPSSSAPLTSETRSTEGSIKRGRPSLKEKGVPEKNNESPECSDSTQQFIEDVNDNRTPHNAIDHTPDVPTKMSYAAVTFRNL